jgi:outer membrane protein OmpA-like peptidoglycan-associated protein
MAEGSAFCNNCGASVTPAASQPLAAAQIPPVVPPVVVSPAVPPVIPPVDPPNVETGWTTVPATVATPDPIEQPQVPATPPPVTPFQSTAPANAPVPTAPVKTNQGKGCITALIVTLVIIVVIVLAVIGGMIYVAHKVKTKVEEFTTKESQHLHDALSDTPAKPGIDMSDVPGSFLPHQSIATACPDVPPTAAPADSNTKPIVPLREGLTWVNAWRRFNGDVEIIFKVPSITPNYVENSSSGIGFNSSNAVKGNQVDTRRLTCRADLQNANTYMTVNDPRLPDIIPQATNFSLSQKSLQELKDNGKVTLTYKDFRQIAGRMVPIPQTAEFSRVEAADVTYPVILNGQPVNLPVIHARGHYHFSGEEKVKKQYSDTSFFDEDGEFYVVDDPQNPMMLLWAMGPVFQVRVVSITYPADKPQIEQQLAKEKKAVIYGIYFDFNQATIKKESQPVLKEIADAMKNNPDWVLTVNGYTDNIGGDAYNLELSKKRSAAVKAALVDQYGIADTRLTTGGFGASGFVDTNETLEGRARNRRVELIRQ